MTTTGSTPEAAVAAGESSLAQLRARLAQLADLNRIGSLLGWDENTKMPEGAAETRGHMLATLEAVRHQRLVDPRLAELLRAAADEAEPGGEDAALIERAARSVALATKLPSELVEEIHRCASRSQRVWTQARRDDDFASFAPELERMLELRRREADHLGWDEHPYDALHDRYEIGSSAARVRRVFGPLKQATVALLDEIRASGRQLDDGPLRQAFPRDGQRAFAAAIAARFGYDFARGRLDESVHPFAQGIGREDVRITTRYHDDFLSPALFGTLHEAGHAMYEQGIAAAYQRSPLGDAISLGVHESQSRLWENLVGRSRAFWEGAYPELQATFPQQLEGVPLDAFYRAVNRVEPSLIRVEADEVTYNLHVMVRFELELDLIGGELAVADLPEAWNAAYAETLGITPPDDSQGVLQDIHWGVGLIGYFPTYALGNLMSVQLFEAAGRAIPDLDDKIRAGEFAPLLDWLNEHVHRHGSRWLPDTLLERATGQRLDAAPYLRYLETKYRPLYGLDG